MTNSTQDDGFHEIQLNGKQLVFLFMAATVVSVVIFLCGVLVGRGVRAERGSVADATATNELPVDITPTQPPPPAPSAASDPTTPPPAPVDDPGPFTRIQQAKQPSEVAKVAPTGAATPGAKPASPSPAVAASAPAPSVAVNDRGASPPATLTDPEPPAAQGYVVQVTALNVRSDADALAKRLTSKGYAAYVSANGSPAVFRVRVGSFKTRREAETMAARLQKEEQLKPWVTR